MKDKEINSIIANLRSSGSTTTEIAEHLISRQADIPRVQKALGMTSCQIEDVMLAMIFKKHASEGRSRAETIFAVSPGWSRDEVCRVLGISVEQFNAEFETGVMMAFKAVASGGGV